MFVTEGMVYALAAAIALTGIGVTFAMTSFIGQMFNNLTGQVNSQAAGLFGVTFNIRWQSVVISIAWGDSDFVVIAAASWRVSRMNIVSAIRSAGYGRRPARTLLQHLAGSSLCWWRLAAWCCLCERCRAAGWRQRCSASLLLTGLVLLAGRALERGVSVVWTERLIYTAIGLGLLALWALPWQLAGEVTPDLFDYAAATAALFLLGGPLTGRCDHGDHSQRRFPGCLARRWASYLRCGLCSRRPSPIR